MSEHIPYRIIGLLTSFVSLFMFQYHLIFFDNNDRKFSNESKFKHRTTIINAFFFILTLLYGALLHQRFFAHEKDNKKVNNILFFSLFGVITFALLLKIIENFTLCCLKISVQNTSNYAEYAALLVIAWGIYFWRADGMLRAYTYFNLAMSIVILSTFISELKCNLLKKIIKVINFSMNVPAGHMRPADLFKKILSNIL